MIRRLRTPLLAMLGAATLSACFSLGGKPPPFLLTLDPDAAPAVGTARTAAEASTLTILIPTAPQKLRTTRIPVYVNETTIQYLTDAVWVEQPGPLFARLLGDTIAARTGRVVLDPGQYSHDPGTRITGTLVRFGLDPNNMQVVIVYDAAMARGGPTGGVVTNRFEARVPVAEATPAAVAPALNQAANQLAAEVAAWVAG